MGKIFVIEQACCGAGAGRVRALEVMGNRAYVGDGEWGLQIIDVSEFRLTQHLSFAPGSTAGLSQSPIPLDAVVSSGLPVTYRVVSGPATVAGNLLTLTGPGTVVLRAEEAGDSQFQPASPMQREILILPSLPTFRLADVSIALGGHVRFRLDGPAGVGVVLQSSPDLKRWTLVSTNTEPEFLEQSSASDDAAVFYRAILR